jgi:hypothetical protein
MKNHSVVRLKRILLEGNSDVSYGGPRSLELPPEYSSDRNTTIQREIGNELDADLKEPDDEEVKRVEEVNDKNGASAQLPAN